MSVRALRTLVTILEVGSFQRAADQLHLTLSAVSMQMRQLEAEFGVALFDRAFRPPRLTGTGMTLAETAREIVGRYDDLTAIALVGQGRDAPLIGKVALGVTSTISVRLLPRILTRLGVEQPHARITVDTGLSDLLVMKVAAGQLDAAIVTNTPDTTRRVTVDTLCEEPLVLVASKAVLTPEELSKEDKRLVAVSLMRRQPYIRFQPNTGIGSLVEQYFDRTSMSPQVGLTLDGVEAIVECVALGLGITILPEPDVRRYGGDRVAYFQLPGPPLTRQIALITRNRPTAQAVRSSLLSVLRSSGSID